MAFFIFVLFFGVFLPFIRLMFYFAFEVEWSEKRIHRLREAGGNSFPMWWLGKKPANIQNTLMHTKGLMTNGKGRFIVTTGIRPDAKITWREKR